MIRALLFEKELPSRRRVAMKAVHCRPAESDGIAFRFASITLVCPCDFTHFWLGIGQVFGPVSPEFTVPMLRRKNAVREAESACVDGPNMRH